MRKFLHLIAVLLIFQQSQALMAFSKSDVALDPPTVTIFYTEMCQGDFFPYPVVINGTGNYTGGIFTAPPGLNISAETGAIIPALSSPGAYVVTYTIAASGEDPMVQATAIATVYPQTIPVFALPETYCIGDNIPALPGVSTNGVVGTWSPAVISNQISATYVFTPEMGCAVPAVLTINIGPCVGIDLLVFLDSNSNGIKDAGEPNFPFGTFTYEKNDDGLLTEIIAPNGNYSIQDGNTANSYDIGFSINPPYENLYQVTNVLSDIHPAAPYPYHEFPVTVVQAVQDLQISLVPGTQPVPGFNYTNIIVFSNNGNTAVASGSVVFAKDAAVAVNSVSPAGAALTPSGFTYNFTNLAPFETRTLYVYMSVPTIPTVELGQLLTNTTSIAYGNGTVNDIAELTQTIIGSYDPNDKTEKHGTEIVWEDFTSDDVLEYTIRFENTGTANAQNIRITDVLDAQLNPETIRFVASSHPCTLEKSGNQLTFVIDDAQLPPSVPETNIGKGYVTFQIKPDAGYALGDIIPNTASIYFDFNPAIVTELWTTEFVAPLTTQTFTGNSFVLYPNPANGVLKIDGKTSGRLSVVVYDLLGKTVLTETLSDDTLQIEKLKPGIYMVSIASGASKSIHKLMVK